MFEVKFLFDNQLIAAVENLIKNSKHKLLIISPFIDLDKRIQDALEEKRNKVDFELFVLFGKNEDNYYKSIKKDSLIFLKQFPNIEIRYNERLHAKFYQNDFDYIMTSLNLYDYSLAKNIEVGIIGNYASKGVLGKVIDGTGSMISQGVNKVGQDVFGLGQKDENPIDKFQTIFYSSQLLYKTKPNLLDEHGIKGLIGGKKIDGFNVIENNFPETKKENIKPTTESKNVIIEKTILNVGKTQSVSQLSKKMNFSVAEITNLMQKSGFINGESITPLGKSKGIELKKYMGKEYIAYPENLEEFKLLK